jgi:hypothetical protein
VPEALQSRRGAAETEGISLHSSTTKPVAAHPGIEAAVWPPPSRLNSVGVGMSEGLEELTVSTMTHRVRSEKSNRC